jgi:hypothetical protein
MQTSLIHLLIADAEFDGRIPDRERCTYWHDDLSVGPVPETGSLEALTGVRENFWRRETALSRLAESDRQRAGAGNQPEDQFLVPAFSLSERDDALRNLDDCSEAVIWCGPNRREVFMLIAILNFLGPSSLREKRITLAPCPHWGVGAYNSEQLAKFFQDRSLITPEFADLARDVWARYTAPDPTGLNDIARELQGRWPPLAQVLRWTLEEYPALENGLSRTEEMLLENACEKRSVARIVGETIGLSDDALGDVPLFEKLWEFLTASAPVLEPVDPELSLARLDSPVSFRRLPVRLTKIGKELLRGQADYVQLNGVDRWIGGVQLRGHKVRWRFDRQANSLVGT